MRFVRDIDGVYKLQLPRDDWVFGNMDIVMLFHVNGPFAMSKFIDFKNGGAVSEVSRCATFFYSSITPI